MDKNAGGFHVGEDARDLQINVCPPTATRVQPLRSK